MRKALLLVFTFFSITAFCQQSISGKVIDTAENRFLQNAVIRIVNPSDSILLKFTRSQPDGSFQLNNLPAHYMLLINYPGYAEFFEMINDSTKKEILLGNIPLTPKSQLLEAVIVKQQIAAIRMKGDTLEYRADSFAVNKGATVAELLKKLPGIQVDRNGQITAQGQKVNKVLVDGEEFFSEDPAVVINNLQAEAVKEVQVFDKKSEQAEFTGIDDGERSKTINLTIKPEKKKGYFAKAALNGGTNQSFDNNVMFNSFKGTRKAAVYGIMSNIGRQGLDWQEAERFGGGNNAEFNEEEQSFYMYGDDNEFTEASNREQGLPTAWSAGLHFSDKWRSEKEKMNANYRFLKKNLLTDGGTSSQYILPDTQYFNNVSRKSANSKMGHQVRGVYELKFDSLTSVKITAGGEKSRNENVSRQQSYALNADSGMVNRNERLLTGVTDNALFNVSALWRKKFKKTGRTWSMNIEHQRKERDLDGLLQSKTEFFNAIGEIDRDELVDQKKYNTQKNANITGNMVYTEPLSKTLFLSLNYGLRFSTIQNFTNSFNKDNTEYDKRDSIFSNDFKFRYAIHSTGADLKLNKKKWMLLIGSGVNFSAFRQTDLVRDSSRRYSYTNYMPKLVIRINPRAAKNFTLRYNGINTPPTMEQLQPVQQNADPLHIQVGNPGLRQSFSHSINFHMYSFKMLTERHFQFGGHSNIIQDAISSATTVDEGGKTTIQPINVNGNYNVMLYGGLGWKLKKPSVYLNVYGNINVSRNRNRVNQMQNINNYTNFFIGPSIDKHKNDKYSVSFRPGIGYTVGRSSLRPDLITRYFTSESRIYTWFQLPWKLALSSEATVSLRQRTNVFDVNRNVIKWDANITRKFMKNNNLEVRLAVYDILNQNIGFERMAESNIITETSYLTLRRMWMLGIHYNISKNP